ncbi:MAG: hypothetical protein ABIG46_02590 [Candidatus Omnitrophota bacterium]
MLNLIALNVIILAAVFFITRKNKFTFDLSVSGIRIGLRNKVLLLLFSALCVFSLSKLAINLVNPPFGWDNLNYHFSFPVYWLKTGNLHIPLTVNCDPAPSYYPINGSLLYLWFMLPLKNVFIADLGQLPFFVIAILSLYSLARKIGLSRQYSFYACGLFLIIPNFFKQMEIAYVDVMIGALFLACLNFLFSLNERLDFKHALIFSISLGLFLGIKSVALPYSVLLMILFTYLYLKNVRGIGVYLPVFLLIIFALGGYSYLRNFLDTANPLYPLDYKLFGKVVFKGVVDMATWKAHFTLKDYSFFKVLFREGLGLQTIFFVLPAIFLSLPVVLLKKKKALNFSLIFLTLVPGLLYLIYRYVIPLANVRYLYALMGLGMVLAFYIAKIMNVPLKLLKILAVICTLDSMFKLGSDEELIFSAILTFAFFALFLFLGRKKMSWLIKPRAVLSIFIIALLALFILERDYRKNEYSRYVKMEDYSGFWPDATRAWEWLNQQSTIGNNIAYVGRPVPFPLFGTDFKNNVYYVSVNNIEPAKLHFYPKSRYRWGSDFLSQQKSFEEDNNYRGNADYQVWLSNLLKRKTEYLFVYSLHQTEILLFPVEDDWAKSHPDKFNPVFSNETVHIYRVNA